MIRVAVVDDHHAVRLGLHAALEFEPDMAPVGEAACAKEVSPLLYRTAPDVIVVDYRLPDVDGLTLCRRIKRDPPAPAVLLHSAFADDWITVPAIIAGVDGIVHKGAPGRELAEAIRTVATGTAALPELLPEILAAASEAVDPGDRPILGMLVHGTAHEEIGRILRMQTGELHHRLDRMLGRLRVGKWADSPMDRQPSIFQDGT
jgi:DNA-binding NarL/FixJ family response regulator